MNQVQMTPARLRLNRRAIPTTGIDVDFFCRGCKGHFSRTTPAQTLPELICRCGSRNLLVYTVARDAASPLRD